MPFDYKKFLADREAKWLPVSDSGRPAGGLTLRVLELLGCEIRNVSRTTTIDCAKHRLRERLLLVPVAVATTMDFSSLNPARVRPFEDKKTGKTYVAILLSQTRPLLVRKGPRPAQPAPPPVEINPVLIFVGNGVYDSQTNRPCVISSVEGGVPSEEEMSKTFVKIRRSNPLSLFVYGQIVSQLDLVRENQRLGSNPDIKVIEKWGYIHAVPFKHDNPNQIIPATVPAQGAPSQFAMPEEWVEEEKRKMREAMETF